MTQRIIRLQSGLVHYKIQFIMGQCLVREMGLHSTQWSDAKKEKLMMHLKLCRDREHKVKQYLETKKNEARMAVIAREHEINKMIRKIKNGGVDSEGESNADDSKGMEPQPEESEFYQSDDADINQQILPDYEEEDQDINNNLMNFDYLGDDEPDEGEQKFQTEEESSQAQQLQQQQSNQQQAVQNRQVRRDEGLSEYHEDIIKYFNFEKTKNLQPNKKQQNQIHPSNQNPILTNEQAQGVKTVEKNIRKPNQVPMKKTKVLESSPKQRKRNQKVRNASYYF